MSIPLDSTASLVMIKIRTLFLMHLKINQCKSITKDDRSIYVGNNSRQTKEESQEADERNKTIRQHSTTIYTKLQSSEYYTIEKLNQILE